MPIRSWRTTTVRISARAAARVRDAGADVRVLRTVHHVDDFTTQVLVDCQRQAILEPDQLVVVSRDWQQRIRTDYGRDAQVIHNGVDTTRFPPLDPARREELRGGLGLSERFVFLAVGGIEPRKGSIFALRAMARLRAELTPAPALVVIGGHSFQDYRSYQDQALAMLLRRRQPLVRAVLQAHRFRPVAGIFHLWGHPFIPRQRAPQGNRQIFIRCDERRIMCEPNTQYVSHNLSPCCWLCAGNRVASTIELIPG